VIGMAEIKLSDEEVAAATEVLKSGQLRQGKQCESFEQEFAAKAGANHAVTCANGSASLHLYYMAALQPGDEVLVPSFTFIATASMPAVFGVKPIFCEVDPETYLIDLDHAESLITEKTKAISPVHLFGNACDVEAVQTFANKHNLKILWDAAQAHGAKYKGQDIGSFGDAVSYSFYPSKNMFVGEGGMICTKDEDLATQLRFLRSHGQTGKYYHEMLGLNYRMTDVEAAIGRKQLERLDDMLAVRHRNGEILNQRLSEIDGIYPQKHTSETTHAYHLYCVRVIEDEYGVSRDALANALMEKEIHNGVHYPRGLHQQPVFEEKYGKQSLPATEKLCSQILAIPVHHGLTEDQVHQVADALQEIRGKLSHAA